MGETDQPEQCRNLANVPAIINKGAAWFNGIGTKSSKGTKIFLVGNVKNTDWSKCPWQATSSGRSFSISAAASSATRNPFQGGPDRRPVRRLHSGRMLPGSARGLRRAGQSGFDDGLGRHNVMDERHLHGRHGQIFRQVPVRGILREVRALPRRPKANAPHSRLDLFRARTGGRPRALEELGEVMTEALLCALSTAANPLLSTPNISGAPNTRPTSRRSAAGLASARSSSVITSNPPSARPACFAPRTARRGHHRGKGRDPRHRPGQVHEVVRPPGGLPLPLSAP